MAGAPAPLSVGPVPESLDYPPLPWARCPRPHCGGSLLVKRMARVETEPGSKVWVNLYDLACLQCTHVLADGESGQPWRLRRGLLPAETLAPALSLLPDRVAV
jgi:hypothetical protein